MDHQGIHEPRQPRSKKTLERILASSIALTTQQSYDEVTIADIAAHAQISVGGFYSRFKNKEALLNKLSECLAQDTNTKIDSALSRDWSSQKLQHLLTHIVEANAELYEKYRGVLTVIHLKTRGLKPLADAESDQNRQRYNESIIVHLENLLLRKREEITHPQPRVAIRIAIACMTSMLRDAIVFQDNSLYPLPRDSRTISNRVAMVMYQYLAGGNK